VAGLTEVERTQMTVKLARYEARLEELELGEATASISQSNTAGSRSMAFTSGGGADAIRHLEQKVDAMRRALGLSPRVGYSQHRPIELS